MAATISEKVRFVRTAGKCEEPENGHKGSVHTSVTSDVTRDTKSHMRSQNALILMGAV